MLSRNRLIIAVLLAASSIAFAQTGKQKVALSDELNHSYSFTTRKAAGSLYTVHIGGLFASPTFEDYEPTFTLKPSQAPKTHSSFFDILTDTHGTHEVSPGEQFYLTTADVDAHFVTFHLQSADVHNVVTHGNSNRTAFRMALKFPLQPGAIATLTATNIHQMADAVFSLSPTGPAAIQLGQTLAQVRQILGQPDQEIDLASKQIMVFRAVKVVFVDGKVTDIQ